MKEEAEIKYLSMIYNSEYKKGLFSISGGCLSDFEKLCKVNGKNFKFRNWLKCLIEEGILKFVDYKDKKEKIPLYIIDKDIIRKKIREIENWKNIYKIASDEYEWWLRY